MSDDDKVQSHETNGTRHLAMDEAFNARMRRAIAAGLENAPVGVVTTPGTNAQIRSNGAMAAKLLVGRNGLLVALCLMRRRIGLKSKIQMRQR